MRWPFFSSRILSLARFGTKRRKNLEENVAALGIALTRDDLERINEAAPKGAASGERYEDMSVVDR